MFSVTFNGSGLQRDFFKMAAIKQRKNWFYDILASGYAMKRLTDIDRQRCFTAPVIIIISSWEILGAPP